MVIAKVRISDQVLKELKRIIAQGNFAAGDKFYSENELMSLLNVGRSSIREAIRLLEVAGLVKVQHGKGIFISDPEQDGQLAFAAWLRENETTLTEHFEIRLILDPKAAAAAAVKADAGNIQKLKNICEQFEVVAGNGNTADMIKIDEQFHLQLAKCTRNRILYMMMKTMTQSFPEGWISSLHVPGRIQKTVVEHRKIVEAIEAGDARLAEHRMEKHLVNALNDIRSTKDAKTGGTS